MALFRYKAVNSAGQVSQGTVDAANLPSATEVLEEKGLVVLRLEQSKRVSKNIFNISLGGVHKKDVVIFSRQLAVMISATVPIVQSLRILYLQTESAALKTIAKAMADDIDGGMQMSQAFAKHPKAFSRFYVAMIRSGETSGRLDEVLNYLADQMEKDYDLTSRIRGAMVYPVFIVLGLVAVGVIMMIYVIPKMADILIESGTELPWMTKGLIAISSFLVNYWWLLIVVVVGAFGAMRLYLRTPAGRISWDNFKLYLPIVGLISKKIIIVRLSRSLSTLIRGGVPIAVALEITGEVVDNGAFKKIIEDTIKEVQDGNSITTKMNESHLFPKIVSEMMSVGERTGKLDEILAKLGDFYDREVSALVASLTSLIEPIIMVIMGLGVGVMVAAVLMPMFQIANSI